VDCVATLPMLLCHAAAILFMTTPEALNPNRDGMASTVPAPIVVIQVVLVLHSPPTREFILL
jgi:hypothetical protein